MIFDRIKELCEKKKISISSLEKALNFSHGTIFAWVKVSPSVNRLQAVADYFGVTLDYLVNGESDETVNR